VIDADGVTRLYDRHARELLGFFVRRTRDPELSLDLLAETFLAAFERRAQCRAVTDSRRAAWLYKIAATKLAGHYRRGAIERRATDRFAVEQRSLTATESEAMRRLADEPESPRLERALAELSADQREAIRLRVIEEHPYADVSKRLGVSEPVVRARVSRGLRALRRIATDGRGGNRDG
jgi:RNA polymerase sigma factor (sigma-70 family)